MRLLDIVAISLLGAGCGVAASPAPPSCAQKDIAAAVKLLSLVPVPARQICSILVHRSPVATVTTTATATVTSPQTVPVTVAATVTGVATVTQTVDLPLTVTEHVTVTAPGITTVSAVPVLKKRNPEPLERRAGKTLGDAFPGCPRQIKTIYLDIATTACNCFLGPATTPIVTNTATVTVRPTVTVTIAQVQTVLLTETTVLTNTALQTVVQTATVTPVDVVAVTFTRAVGPGTKCIYNQIDNQIQVNNSPANNYQAGITQCEAACTADPNCKFFFFYRTDPAYQNQGDTSAQCFLVNAPYSADLFQCNVGFVLYYVGYNKN